MKYLPLILALTFAVSPLSAQAFYVHDDSKNDDPYAMITKVAEGKKGDSFWVYYGGIPEDSTVEIFDMAGDTVVKKNIKAGTAHVELALKKQLLSGSFAVHISGKSGKKIPYVQVHQDEFRYDAPQVDIKLSEKKRTQTITLGTGQHAEAEGFTLVFESMTLDENNNWILGANKKPQADITVHTVGYQKGFYTVGTGKEVGNFHFAGVPGNTVEVRVKKLNHNAETVTLSFKLKKKG